MSQTTSWIQVWQVLLWMGSCGAGVRAVSSDTKWICRRPSSEVNIASCRSCPKPPATSPRATNAYSWAKGVVEQSNTDVLYITPTVRNELMRAPQVSDAVLMHCIF